jgi:hypothetical protein
MPKPQKFKDYGDALTNKLFFGQLTTTSFLNKFLIYRGGTQVVIKFAHGQPYPK